MLNPQTMSMILMVMIKDAIAMSRSSDTTRLTGTETETGETQALERLHATIHIYNLLLSADELSCGLRLALWLCL